MTNDGVFQRKWDERARHFGNDLRGVLFQGLPDSANATINSWHESIVRSHFILTLPHDAHIVDIGAGYGRLSALIQQEKPQSHLFGVDFSQIYCQTYAAQISSAVCADIHNLPFAPNAWEGILVVTTLMYVSPERSQPVVNQIIASLKPGGIALFVDPGLELIRLLHKIAPSLKQKTTGGVGFSRSAYLSLFQNANCLISGKGGNAFFTLFLPALFITRKMPKLADKIGAAALWLDRRLPLFSKYALHRWILIQRV
ncbi:MAG: class I SAM-dependent methyltransferase [Chloroflexi bacterium]|nr:class I SAM-dependent methyltransferase [Chloroflexota bacterium]